MDFLNSITFPVVADVDLEFSEYATVLAEPSGLGMVHLCSNWAKQTYRSVDFSNTTNAEAIQKILTFYRHGTYRRMVGTHIYFDGIENGVILLSD